MKRHRPVLVTTKVPELFSISLGPVPSCGLVTLGNSPGRWGLKLVGIGV